MTTQYIVVIPSNPEHEQGLRLRLARQMTGLGFETCHIDEATVLNPAAAARLVRIAQARGFAAKKRKVEPFQKVQNLLTDLLG